MATKNSHLAAILSVPFTFMSASMGGAHGIGELSGMVIGGFLVYWVIFSAILWVVHPGGRTAKN